MTRINIVSSVNTIDLSSNCLVKLIEEGGSKGGDRRDRKDKEKDKEDVPKGPPPEVGIIYRFTNRFN